MVPNVLPRRGAPATAPILANTALLVAPPTAARMPVRADFPSNNATIGAAKSCVLPSE